MMCHWHGMYSKPAVAAAGPPGPEEETPKFKAGLSAAGSSRNGNIISGLRAINSQTHDAVVSDVALFLLTSETPFIRINNQYIKQAFLRLGVKLPDEKYFRGDGLERIHNMVMKMVIEELESVFKVGWVGCIRYI